MRRWPQLGTAWRRLPAPLAVHNATSVRRRACRPPRRRARGPVAQRRQNDRGDQPAFLMGNSCTDTLLTLRAIPDRDDDNSETQSGMLEGQAINDIGRGE